MLSENASQEASEIKSFSPAYIQKFKPVKVLQASAGSGKTFSLTVQYLILLFSGSEKKYREILAVTFTNKATEEMKTRILSVLRSLANDDASEKTAAYRELIMHAHPYLNKDSLKKNAYNIYRNILHDYTRFAVMNMDSFIQKMIRNFSFELGFDSSYGVELDFNKITNELVEKLKEKMNVDSKITNWISLLVKDKLDDNGKWNFEADLIALTKEIFKERFSVSGEALNNIQDIDAYFTNCINISKQKINDFQKECIARAAQLWNQLSSYNLNIPADLYNVTRSCLLKLATFKEVDLSTLNRIFQLIDSPDKCFNKRVDIAIFNSFNAHLKSFHSYYVQHCSSYIFYKNFIKKTYYLRLMNDMVGLLKEWREESENLLLSDGLALVCGLTEESGDDTSFIWEKMGNRFRYFLFDEFQDTSTNQWKAFKPLVKNALATSQPNLTSQFIVGDVKQAIYRWRNGDWKILHSAIQNDLGKSFIEHDALTENYRSASEIIQFNNRLFQKLPEFFQELINSEINESGNADLITFWEKSFLKNLIIDVYKGAEQNQTVNTPEGGVVKINAFKKEKESAVVFKDFALANIYNDITQLKNDKNYSYNDICVLARTNAQAKEVVSSLMEKNIPVVSAEALMIAENLAVKLIVYTLGMISSFESQNAYYKAHCIGLYQRIKKMELNADHYLNLKETKLQDLHYVLPKAICENSKTFMQLPLPEVIEKIIEAYELDKEKTHLPYLFAFRDLITGCVRQGEKGIKQFLKWWKEEGCSKALPSADGIDAVQVMTIHKSKGLAFRAVIIPFTDVSTGGKSDIVWLPAHNSPFPELKTIAVQYKKELISSNWAEHYVEEKLMRVLDELNLMYVACTRAIDFLSIYSCPFTKKNECKNIGSAISFLFNEELQDDIFQSGIFLQKKAEKNGESVISLQSYPTSNRLMEIYDEKEDKHILHLLNEEEAGIKGSLLHDILSKIKTNDTVDECLSAFNLEGFITLDETPLIKQQVNEILNHPELKKLLSKAESSIEERAIINVDGKTYRPDKILLCKNEVVIIDYKFTRKMHPDHEAQIKNYINILVNMGYKNVKGYLFYAISKSLKPV